MADLRQNLSKCQKVIMYYMLFFFPISLEYFPSIPFYPHFWKHTFRHSKQHPDSLVCLPSKFLCLSLTFSTWPRSIPFLRLKEKLSLSSPNHTESYLLIYLPVQWFGTVCRSIESNLCGFFTNYTCGPFL